MLNNELPSGKKLPANKVWQYLRKNGLSMLMMIALGILVLHPDAKSFMLKQFMATGFFNASIAEKEIATTKESTFDFDFYDEKGNAFNTSSLRGKVVFINFWASWCPPCRAEFPSIEELYAKFKDSPDVYFLTVNEDKDFSIAKSYMSKEKYIIPFFKTNGAVPAELYTGSLPTTIVLDKNGNIRYKNEGFANYSSDKFIQQMQELIKE